MTQRRAIRRQRAEKKDVRDRVVLNGFVLIIVTSKPASQRYMKKDKQYNHGSKPKAGILNAVMQDTFDTGTSLLSLIPLCDQNARTCA